MNIIRKYRVVSLVIVRRSAGIWIFNVLARTATNIVNENARISSECALRRRLVLIRFEPKTTPRTIAEGHVRVCDLNLVMLTRYTQKERGIDGSYIGDRDCTGIVAKKRIDITSENSSSKIRTRPYLVGVTQDLQWSFQVRIAQE